MTYQAQDKEVNAAVERVVEHGFIRITRCHVMVINEAMRVER